MTGRIRLRLLVLLLTSLLVFSGCTVVKPVVCMFSYPLYHMAEEFEEAEEENEEKSVDTFKSMPAILAIPTICVLFPLEFATYAVEGVIAGLASGFASDLNLLLQNATFSDSCKSLFLPFKTNVRESKEDD